MMHARSRRLWLGVLAGLLAMGLTGTVFAEPFADRVSPQRLTLFVGQGEQRLRIEGRDLDQVDSVAAIDTSEAGYSTPVPEVRARVLNATAETMTVVIRADAPPANGKRIQLALMFGHQGYLIPAHVFQMEVR